MSDTATATVAPTSSPSTPSPDPVLDAIQAEFARVKPQLDEGRSPSSQALDAQDAPASAAAPPVLAEGVDWDEGALPHFERAATSFGISQQQQSELLSWYAMWSGHVAADPNGDFPLAAMERAFEITARRMGLSEDVMKKLKDYHDRAEWRATSRQQQGDGDGDGDEAQETALEELRREWGEQLDAKIKAAKVFVKEQGGDELLDLLAETGLGNDARFVRLFAKLAENGARPEQPDARGQRPSSRDSQPQQTQQSQPEQAPWKLSRSEDIATTPQSPAAAARAEQAKREITSLMSDVKNPYFNPTHPGHDQAKAKMKALHEQAYPSDGVLFVAHGR